MTCVRVTANCSCWIISVCIAFGAGIFSVESRIKVSRVKSYGDDGKVGIDESIDEIEEQFHVPDFSYQPKNFSNYPENEETPVFWSVIAIGRSCEVLRSIHRLMVRRLEWQYIRRA